MKNDGMLPVVVYVDGSEAPYLTGTSGCREAPYFGIPIELFDSIAACAAMARPCGHQRIVQTWLETVRPTVVGFWTEGGSYYGNE